MQFAHCAALGALLFLMAPPAVAQPAATASGSGSEPSAFGQKRALPSATATSGEIPTSCTQVLSRVSHLAIDSRKPPLPPGSCVHSWMVPLPKVGVPTRVARPAS